MPKCWYEVPQAQIAGSWGSTFWKIFLQPFQLSKNVKPGPAGHFATIILYSQTAGIRIIQWHPLLWTKPFHTESQLPKYAIATVWKDHQYYTFLLSKNGYSNDISLPKLLSEMHVIPDKDISFSFSKSRLVNWGKESPTGVIDFNSVHIEKEHVWDLGAYFFTVPLQNLCSEHPKKIYLYKKKKKRKKKTKTNKKTQTKLTVSL